MKKNILLFYARRACILSVCIVPISAEYIVIDSSRTSLAPAQQHHQAIYSVLQNYAWPMSLIHLSHAQQANNQEELAKLRQAMQPNWPHELAVINQELRKISPYFTAHFIPQTVYEYIALPFFAEDKILVEVDFQLTDILEERNAKFRDIAKLFEIENRREVFALKFFEVNSVIINFLKTNNLWDAYQDTNHADFIEKLPIPLISMLSMKLNLRRFPKKKRTEIATLKPTLENHFQTIATIINQEYQAFDRNKALLYRGTSPLAINYAQKIFYPLETPFDLRSDRHAKNALRSISYGNSLFAGLHDCAACSYFFFFTQNEVCESIDSNENLRYLLTVSKSEYAFGQLSNLFFIAPFATLPALCAKGEFFHSRSKVYYNKRQQDMNKEIKGINTEDFLNIDKARFFTKPTSLLAAAYDISDYILEHNIIINVPNYRWEKGEKQAVNYRPADYTQAQRELVRICDKYIKLEPFVLHYEAEISPELRHQRAERAIKRQRREEGNSPGFMDLDRSIDEME